MSVKLKGALRYVGFALAILGVAWIVSRFAATGVFAQVRTSGHAVRLIEAVAIAVPIYAVGLCCAGFAWCAVQIGFVERRPPLRQLFSVYATSQFAKYLPGNVGHYVGRHVLLRRYGLSHTSLLLGNLSEAGFLVLGALVWSAPVLPKAIPWAPISAPPWIVLTFEVIALLVGYALVQWLRARNEKFSACLPLPNPRWFLAALPLELLLFTAMAVAVALPGHVLSSPGDLGLLAPVVAASWLAGFLIVGAPAGIGVREAIFLALLRGAMTEADILLLAAAFRVITFFGDVLVLLLGLVLSRFNPSSAPNA